MREQFEKQRAKLLEEKRRQEEEKKAEEELQQIQTLVFF